MGFRKLLTAGMVLASLVGCTYKTDKPIREVEIDGYNVKVGIIGGKRKIVIEDPNTSNKDFPSFPISIVATDYPTNGMGRFDIIDALYVPKGHPLEQKANLQELERMYQEAMERRIK